ncbi:MULTISPECIES: serine/threonine-protein kinase [Streptomyces]|uniref:non-specific serine/threonine protein kinase n=1 Tax=Streptomyces tsukubensis (strain DSM 42081 / NBRC 108919 / NRRL 18488 / 9993) TaxID=1114943 RepID=I2N233_STRT9|nr:MULTISPECIES: serine/threonine-protein kinase [Streptomyces]AZK95214.1 serine/threonine protein kinase [Streptomyces tsukubensis]EIF91080.1 serine/threonine protein kinase [Streptomyces tsukubensis NRRL18488]MYS65964.1 protein kinase [Streptomyces sp. SID5473]QKM68725.1 serine/threonine protein kinase [Streptomyces tsukubensis NRRL18488]TAI43531.1 serine/threonine protein kinase [Streptomyces tsukubensis]
MGEVFAARYELIDPIGHGGVGAVWRAWDHRRRRYVAAKVLQQSDAHTLLRFVREQAMRIDHPHVLAPASWAADDDKVLFTMDLVGGGSLAHVIGDYGPLPPHYVCALLDQLLAGLSAVHAEGVVHRDIKPANILLEATGTGRPHLRLSDFGIAMRKGEPRLTETNYVVGTPGYFAPEQMTGAEPDFPADLFAVGLVGLYLLQGQKPDADALVEHFVEHGTPGAPLGIAEPLWQVLAGLLQPDPEDRFKSAAGARKALLAAIDALPEPGPDDEPVEIFDQLEPLPEGFGPDGPEGPPPRTVGTGRTTTAPAPDPGPSHPGGSGAFDRTGGSGDFPAGDSASHPAGTTGTGPHGPGLRGTGSSGIPSGAPTPAGPVGPTQGSSSSALPALPPVPPVPPHTGGVAMVPAPPSQPPTPPPHPIGSTPGTTPATPLGAAPASPLPVPHTPPEAPPKAPPAPPGLPLAPAAPAVAHGAHPLSAQASEPPRPHGQTAPTTPLPYGTPRTPPTRTYTAQSPRVPLSRAEIRRAARRRKRALPPLRFAIPLLVLALVCYAVGFWALGSV